MDRKIVKERYETRFHPPRKAELSEGRSCVFVFHYIIRMNKELHNLMFRNVKILSFY